MRHLSESRGHLHLFELHHKKQQLYVYEIESDCSAWFVKYAVDLHPLMVAFPLTATFDYRITLVGVVREANDEDSHMVLSMHRYVHPSETVRFYFKDFSVKKICDWINIPFVAYPTSPSYPLIQTLLPLCSDVKLFPIKPSSLPQIGMEENILFCPRLKDHREQSVFWSLLTPDQNGVHAPVESSPSLSCSSIQHPPIGVPQTGSFAITSLQPNLLERQLLAVSSPSSKFITSDRNSIVICISSLIN